MLGKIKDVRNCSEKLFNIIENGTAENLIEFLESMNPDFQLRNISFTKWSGYGLLHKAASIGRTDLCMILIKYGANIDEKSTRGK